MKKFIFLIALLLSGCGESLKQETPVNVVDLERKGIIHYNIVESELIKFKGDILTILFHREESHGTYVEIYNKENMISSFPWPYGLGSAIVTDKICLFGVSDWVSSNSVYKTCLEDYYPKSTVKLFDSHVFNTSVVFDGSQYVMAYETNYGVPFSIQFKVSNDLESWTDIGVMFKPEKYAAAPHIKYIDGTYVLFWLDKGNKFVTRVTTTTNFKDFKDNTTALIAPITTEGINTSDVSILETTEGLLINYADGDQKTWGNIRQAVYEGTLRQLIEEVSVE